MAGAYRGRSLGNEIAGLNGCTASTFPDSDKVILKVVVSIYAFMFESPCFPHFMAN